MPSPDVTQRPSGADAGAVRTQLARVLASSGFVSSSRLSALLTFLVEESLAGRAGELKESTVAVQVFGRRPDFDPRFDSIVRTQATQLRRRLREYYGADGAADPVIIEVPAGGYAPAFRAPAVAPERPKRSRGRMWAAAAAVAGLALLGAAAIVRWSGPSAGAPPSLAILPFQDFSGGEDAGYIADGLVEDLTTMMSRAPGLSVAARTSAFHFRGSTEDVRTIGRRLGVSAVLEGSVRRQGGQIKVTAQLIAADTGYHIWSNAYEGPVANLPTMQRDIALAVARALGLNLARAPVYSHAPPPEAYDAYLRARFVRGGVPQRREQSVPLFERALKLDPEFAAAWAALASTHAVMAFHQEGDAEAHSRAAHEAARKAMELDETIPETHVALATLAYSRERDWPSAERGFQRALELNPSYAYAHRGYAVGLISRGRFDEALAELDLARRLDPIADAASNERAVTLYCAGRYGEAIEAARRVLEMKPEFYFARIVMGDSLAQQGRSAEAVAKYEEAMAATGRVTYMLARIGYARAREGRREDARRLLEEIVRDPGPAAQMDAARVNAGLGDYAEAVRRLELAEQGGASDVNFIAVEPVYQPLRREPAFRALVKRLGLPER